MLKRLIHKLLKKSRLYNIHDSWVSPCSKIESGSNFVKSYLDSYSFCGYDCDVYHAKIGRFVSIANDVVVGGGAHPVQWVSTSPVFYEGRDSITHKFSEFPRVPVKMTIIGSDVWIGRRAIIMSGVHVGHGAVVGAGSVVTKNIPPYEIWAGNPARHIKDRFEEPIKQQLLQSKWWELSDTDIDLLAEDIRDPAKFIESIKQRASNG